MGIGRHSTAGEAAAPHPLPHRGTPPLAQIQPSLLAGFAVASIGGPLALAYQLLPDVIGSAGLPSIGLVTVIALALFAFPLAIWYRYSARIASAGGLYAFVEAAAGRTAARIHGAVWIVSYFLYLPATVTFLVYELLPSLAPGIAPYRATLELLVPLAVTAALLAPLRLSLAPVALFAAAQLGLLVVLGGAEIGRVGFPLSSLATHGNLGAVARGTGTGSLLFLCASLPLYLGAEVRRSKAVMGKTIAGAAALVGLCVLFAVVPLAAVSQSLVGAELPAYAIAGAYLGHGAALVAGYGTLVSILVLVFAEFLALGRLLTAMAPIGLRPAVFGIGALFLASDAAALLGPTRTYEDMVRPSLGALYLSLLIVFVVYPLFERSRRLLLAAPVALVASAPLAYGFYLVLENRLAS